MLFPTLCAITLIHPQSGLAYVNTLEPGVIVGLKFTGATDNGHPMGGDIVVERKVGGQWKEVWRQPKLNPWKLTIGDLFSAGHQNIVVGVYKKSPMDPVMEKRVFIYDWSGTRLKPKWLSSRLTCRFDDYAVFTPKGEPKALLFSLDRLPAGKQRVSFYRPLPFGMQWSGGSPNVAGVARFEQTKKDLFIVGPKKTYRLVISGNNLTLDWASP